MNMKIDPGNVKTKSIGNVPIYFKTKSKTDNVKTSFSLSHKSIGNVPNTLEKLNHI